MNPNSPQRLISELCSVSSFIRTHPEKQVCGNLSRQSGNLQLSHGGSRSVRIHRALGQLAILLWAVVATVIRDRREPVDGTNGLYNRVRRISVWPRGLPRG